VANKSLSESQLDLTEREQLSEIVVQFGCQMSPLTVFGACQFGNEATLGGF
jgi:hypothetical protein